MFFFVLFDFVIFVVTDGFFSFFSKEQQKRFSGKGRKTKQQNKIRMEKEIKLFVYVKVG